MVGLGETSTGEKRAAGTGSESLSGSLLSGEEKWRVMGVWCVCPSGFQIVSLPLSLGIRTGAAEPRYLWNQGDSDFLKGIHVRRKP